MPTTDSPVIPFLIRILYGESAAPKRPSVVALLSDPCTSACKDPRLRNRIPICLLFLVLEAQSVPELKDARTHACRGAACQSDRQSLGQLGSTSPTLSTWFRESKSSGRETYRRTSLSTTKNVHAGHGLVDFTKTPWSGFLPRFFVVSLGLVVLIQNIIFVKFEERLNLCHHPGQRDVRFALVRISSTDVLMHAREPVLSSRSQSGELETWRR